MGVSSRSLDEYGYALCSCCRKKYSVDNLAEPCEFCGKWFCENCAREVPAGHGHGKICVRCYEKIKRMDRKK